MREERFRLPGSSYEELVKIIRAYGTHEGEAGPGDVAQITGMHPTMVSRNNAFLVAMDLIQGGKKKVITDKGRRLAGALEHDIRDEIRSCWREIVLANDFLQKVLSAVRIRKGMEASTLQAHIAYSAGQPKNPTVMAGAGAVVDILKGAGSLEEEEGKLVVTRTGDLGVPETTVERGVSAREEGAPQVQPVGRPVVVPFVGAPSVTIQIQVQCSAADIDTVAPKLRALLEELSRPSAPETPNAHE